jgi:hypothetical protein
MVAVHGVQANSRTQSCVAIWYMTITYSRRWLHGG